MTDLSLPKHVTLALASCLFCLVWAGPILLMRTRIIILASETSRFYLALYNELRNQMHEYLLLFNLLISIEFYSITAKIF